jgi:signal peptidase I
MLGPRIGAKPGRIARLVFWPLLMVLLLTTFVFYVLFLPLQVVGDSMVPSLMDGDRLLVTKSYERPARGDVVIIHGGATSDEDVVKRVVAVAGDTVEIRDDVALVNGVVEITTDVVRVAERGVYIDPMIVPEGHVYVLGDNRPVSLDSRYMGPVSLERVAGRAEFVFLPLGRASAIR